MKIITMIIMIIGGNLGKIIRIMVGRRRKMIIMIMMILAIGKYDNDKNLTPTTSRAAATENGKDAILSCLGSFFPKLLDNISVFLGL